MFASQIILPIAATLGCPEKTAFLESYTAPMDFYLLLVLLLFSHRKNLVSQFIISSDNLGLKFSKKCRGCVN